jgi:hypothetical protein
LASSNVSDSSPAAARTWSAVACPVASRPTAVSSASAFPATARHSGRTDAEVDGSVVVVVVVVVCGLGRSSGACVQPARASRAERDGEVSKGHSVHAGGVPTATGSHVPGGPGG